MQQGRILAANHQGAYVIRLEGDVRLTLCTTIDDFIQQMFADPEFASVWVDVCAAEGIDSTTLGLLAKLALKVKERFGFMPAIYCGNPGIRRLLNSMAFNRLYEVKEEPCCNADDVLEIPTKQGSEEAVKRKVIEAHRILMGLSEENRARFKDLISALERS